MAALLATADWAEAVDEGRLANYLRETADSWNACIEGWVYVRGTSRAEELGIDGYYARILPAEAVKPPYPGQHCVEFCGKAEGSDGADLAEVISTDALALVRFGLRHPNDLRIRNTVAAIDATIKLQTSRGPIWHRYSGDRFGEREDGSPFEPEAKGVGRAWPLMIGERAHYELARGDAANARRLCATMANYAGDTGMIPEQVWDSEDLPQKKLFLGRPTGSAAPLVWAHSEYLKLRRSLHEGRVFDTPTSASQRYVDAVAPAAHGLFRLDHACETIPEGTPLRIEATNDVQMKWTVNGGNEQTFAKDQTALSVRYRDIPASELHAGSRVKFEIDYVGDDGQAKMKECSLRVATRSV